MERYKNWGGNSGVIAYEIGADFIRVQFRDGKIYLYTYQSAGRENIERMKVFAVDGQGLSGFISTTVGKLYVSKSG